MEQSQARQKARALLWAWGRALERCKQLEADLKDLEELCAGLHDPTRAQQLTGMPGSGAISDSTAKTAQRALERLEIYEAEIERVQAEIQETLGMKRAIDGFVADQIAVDRRILELRYVRECSWVYIGIKLGIDEGSVRKRERKIIDKLYNSARFCPFV